MTNKRKALFALSLTLPLSLLVIWFLKRGDHHHAPEKQTGTTSFDVYADGGNIHLLELMNHALAKPANEHAAHDKVHQMLRYSHVIRGKNVFSAEIALAQGERVVSRRSNDVQIAAAGDHLLAVWQISGTGFGNRGPMRFAESLDAGRTWQTIAGPTAASRTDDQGFFDLLADNTGRFHLVWLDVESREKGLRYATLEKAKWQKVTTIDSVTCQCCWNTLKKNPTGELIVLYRSAAPRDMAVATLKNGQWLKGETVDNFSWKINACPHAGGGLSAARSEYTFAVTWTGESTAQGAYFSRRDNAIGKWNLRQKFGSVSARNPDVAENGSNLAVVWDEYEGDNRLIKAMLSADAGKSWSQTQTISAKKAIASYPRLLPEGNRFRVFWSESKNNDLTTRSAPL